jgi:UDP-glucose 4-epimerase
MIALVTGANGFLGRYVVSALLERGVTVRALVRPAAKLDELSWPSSVEVFRADLRAGEALERAFDGVEVLVHLAAAVVGGEDGQLSAAVVGTERLLGAMAHTNCRRLVFASSFAVYDWSRIRGTLDESSPVEPAPDLYVRGGYAIAKAWQERVVRRFAESHGWGLTVLRPGFIWGQGHADLAALGPKLGKLRFVIGPWSRMPLTYVENCADLFAIAATDPRARAQTFNVVDDEGVRIWPFLGDYMAGTGQRGFRIPIPYHPTYFLVNLAFNTVFRRNAKLPGLLIPAGFESRLKPLRFSNRHAREVLGWTPRLNFHECLVRTFGALPTGTASGA